jgi:hydrogenase expression/formation protein HypC
MCIGIPMTVIKCDDMGAICDRRGQYHQVSMLLIGYKPAGTKVLVHIDTAIRELGEDEARLIDDALDGLAAAVEGRDFEHLFADLIGREPQLPDHLIPID